MYLSMYPEVSSEGVLLIPLWFISNTGKEKEKLDYFYTVLAREDKTIEIAVPFPAPEKGDNRGLSPFHPRIIIVIGECPLLSPEANFLFVPFKAFPFPENHWSVWKTSPRPRPLLPGRGQGRGPLHSMYSRSLIFTISSTWHDLHLQQLLLCSLQ